MSTYEQHNTDISVDKLRFSSITLRCSGLVHLYFAYTIEAGLSTSITVVRSSMLVRWHQCFAECAIREADNVVRVLCVQEWYQVEVLSVCSGKFVHEMSVMLVLWSVKVCCSVVEFIKPLYYGPDAELSWCKHLVGQKCCIYHVQWQTVGWLTWGQIGRKKRMLESSGDRFSTGVVYGGGRINHFKHSS